MKQKGFAPIIILVGVLVIALVTGGIFYAGRITTPKVSQSPKNTITSETRKVTSTPTSDETANWKTYTYAEVGYSFKYPVDWQINADNGVWGRGIDLVKVDNTQKKMPFGDTENEVSYVISVSVKDNPKGYSAKEKYLSIFSQDSRPRVEKTMEDVILDGEKGIKYDTFAAPGGLVKIVAVNHRGKIYELSYGGLTPEDTHLKFYSIFNQILSTFKFTN